MTVDATEAARPATPLAAVTIPTPLAAVDAVMAAAVRVAGGATLAPEGIGAWRDDTGAVITEAVRVITVYAAADIVAALIDAVITAARGVGEAAVAYAITPDAAAVVSTGGRP